MNSGIRENPDFSLILACYNEERSLKKGIREIEKIFITTKLKYEIIFVDDKSTDNTVEIIKKILSSHPDWCLIEHGRNRGRGKAVSDGIKIAKSPIVGFIDVDLSTSPWYLLRLIQEVKEGFDIATAMRVYKLKPRTLFRWIISKSYNFTMRMVLNCNLRDTETGCKVFDKERILSILEKIKTEHWFWDTEIMVRSEICGYKILEVPSMFIREGLNTTVRVFKDTKDYLINLIKFRHELKKLRKNGI